MLKRLINTIKKIAPNKGAISKPVFEVAITAMREDELRLVSQSRDRSSEERVSATIRLRRLRYS